MPACTTHSLTRQPQSLGMAGPQQDTPERCDSSSEITQDSHSPPIHACTYAQKDNLCTWCLISSLSPPRVREYLRPPASNTLTVINCLEPVGLVPEKKHLRLIRPPALKVPPKGISKYGSVFQTMVLIPTHWP